MSVLCLVLSVERPSRRRGTSGESAFTPKWCFGVMTMWLVGLMTGVKDLSQVIRSLVASTDAVVPSLTKKEKTACLWTRKIFSVTFESEAWRTMKRGHGEFSLGPEVLEQESALWVCQ